MGQSVDCPVLGFSLGDDLRVVGWTPDSSSLPSRGSTWGSLTPYPPSLALSLSLSLSNKQIYLKKKKRQVRSLKTVPRWVKTMDPALCLGCNPMIWGMALLCGSVS